MPGVFTKAKQLISIVNNGQEQDREPFFCLIEDVFSQVLEQRHAPIVEE